MLPPHIFPHGFPVDVQPHVFATPPPPHVLGATQLSLHTITWPQLLVAVPHALPVQVVATGSGTQQLVPTHTSPLGQVAGQPMV
jgi:hypothetical protein